MATTPSNIPGYDSRHSDGTPGLEYYSNECAFAWTGDTSDPIEISFRGYGEPVAHLIHVSPRCEFAEPRPLLAHIGYFQRVCEQWIEFILEQDDDGAEAWITDMETEMDTETRASVARHVETGLYDLRFRQPAPQA
ncbi:hypothetical protein GCM10028801_44770 [Nocardioides maradonensis]